MARRHLVLERRRFGHRSGAHVEAHRATLHVDDRMVSILASWRRGEADNISGLYFSHHLLEREGG
jgi:hypothetical protein